MAQYLCKWTGEWFKERVPVSEWWHKQWVVEADNPTEARLKYYVDYDTRAPFLDLYPFDQLYELIECIDLTNAEWCMEVVKNNDLSLSYYLIPYSTRYEFFKWTEMDELSDINFKDFEVNPRRFSFKYVRHFTEEDQLPPLYL